MFDEKVVKIFLAQQDKLLGKKIFETAEEAEEFLEESMAQVCTDLEQVREYLDDAGMDVDGMSNQELAEALEVFVIPGIGYLVVEG